MAGAPTFYPEAAERFGAALEAQGFVRVDNPSGMWEGDIEVDWIDSSGISQHSDHRISISIDAAFPFKKPDVKPLFEMAAGTRHRAPVASGGALCLYSERIKGWMPEYTGEDLLERVREWFVHFHQDDWREQDQAFDLQLYYPRTKRLYLAVTGEDWNPPNRTHGRFAIRESLQCFLISDPTADAEMPRPKEDRISSHLGVRPQGHSVGVWFRLNAEPTPSENLAEVLKDVDSKSGMSSGFSQEAIKGLVGVAPRKEFRTLIGLGYPDPSGSTQWIFLDVIIPTGKYKSTRWQRLLSEIKVRALETAPASSSDLLRRTKHTETLISAKSVLIFGLGAVGSSLALLLAKSGLGRITGIDREQLRPGNCIRHEAGLRLTGLTKAAAVSVEIGQHAPDCKFEAREETWKADELLHLAKSVDLVIDATANPAFSLLINEVCVETQRKLMVVATYRRANIGRIRIVSPGENACLVCYLQHESEPDYPLIPVGEEGKFVEGGCGDPTVEASAIDIEYITNVAARAAKDILSESEMPGSEALVVIAPLADSTGLLTVPGTHWSTREKLPFCGACGKI